MDFSQLVIGGLGLLGGIIFVRRLFKPKPLLQEQPSAVNNLGVSVPVMQNSRIRQQAELSARAQKGDTMAALALQKMDANFRTHPNH
jgi:hypothetical protein